MQLFNLEDQKDRHGHFQLIHAQDFQNIIIQRNIWKSGIIPVPLTTGQQSAFYDCLTFSDFGILWIEFSDPTIRAYAENKILPPPLVWIKRGLSS